MSTFRISDQTFYEQINPRIECATIYDMILWCVTPPISHDKFKSDLQIKKIVGEIACNNFAIVLIHIKFYRADS